MSAVETRAISRDSLFLLAEVAMEGGEGSERVKIRNLSPGGAMVEGGIHPRRGARLSVNLRQIGWVSGSVAWTQGARFGVAFDTEIDPKLVRQPQVASGDLAAPRFVRTPGVKPREQDGSLRKI